MKNVWKGLVVGGLTGVTAGIALDLFSRAPDTARDLSRQVREHGPEAARWAHGVVERAGELVHEGAQRAGEIVHESDAPEKARDAMRRVKDSPAAKTAAKVTSDAAGAARDAAKDAASSIKH